MSDVSAGVGTTEAHLWRSVHGAECDDQRHAHPLHTRRLHARPAIRLVGARFCAAVLHGADDRHRYSKCCTENVEDTPCIILQRAFE